MYKPSVRVVVCPADRSLNIKQHIVASDKHRYLRQIVDIRLAEILRLHRTAVTEHPYLRRIADTRSLQVTERHLAYAALAHADLHPLTVGQNRVVLIRMNARYGREP